MKRLLLILTLSLLATIGKPLGVSGQQLQVIRENLKGGRITGYDIIKGDTVAEVTILTVPVFTKPKDMRQYQKLVNNVKKVYPYAKDAKFFYEGLVAQLALTESEKEREQITDDLEKELVKRYTPVLERMTRSQGLVLIKLIDREVNRTAFQLLEDYRSKFSAR
ncbi:MAG: DUF4294 domain-containing protein, partial [Tidjanibacter sp.]|nr:DUF4294 domain-containing protein [Tidjanibacter sp.]